jgi:hypothetical protein
MKKALLAVALLLLGLEAATRFVLFPQSKDYVRFAGYDAQASQLHEAQALRIAVLGNSAAEEGIDEALLEQSLTASLGRPVQVGMFLADGSEIVTWHAMANRYFWSRDAAPDVVLVNWFDSLADRPSFEYVRIGNFFASPAEWGYYMREQLHTLPERMEFLLSSVWATYGARDRMRDRVLEMLVPDYEGLLAATHASPVPAGDAAGEAGAGEADSGEADSGEAAAARPGGSVARFTALTRLVEAAGTHDASVLLVAFPLRTQRYSIDPAVQAMHARGELGVVDLRATAGLSPASYRDGIHLLAPGRLIYTRALAAALDAPLRAR